MTTIPMKKERVLTQVETLDVAGLAPAVALARLQARGEPAFLFESAVEATRAPGYTYLGVRPLQTIQCRQGSVFVRTRAPASTTFGAETKVPGEPATTMEALLSRFARAPQEGLPPFAGGMVGYLGFEFTRYLEPVLDRDLRTAPVDAEFMLFGTLIVFDHASGRVLLIGTTFLDRESLSEGAVRVAAEFRDLRALLGKAGAREEGLVLTARPSPSVNLEMTPELGEQRFSGAVNTVKAKIRRGDLFQCVISDRFRFPLTIDPLRVYAALAQISPAPYQFYVDFGHSILLGASPERLVSVEDGLIETHPIAGTRPRGATPAADLRFERQLLASVKERAEHAMLVDLGRNDVGRVAVPGTVTVETFMEVRRFSHVMHLVSTVQGRLPAGDPSFRALTACFPAGTLSGAPKISAIRTISGLETVSRGVYGGTLMLQDFSGRLDSCIIIRSLSIKGKDAFVQAGAGIVADSIAAREYEEVRNKTRNVVKAVELALTGVERSQATVATRARAGKAVTT